MSFKEILHKSLIAYFVLVTCITAGIMILGVLFDPDAKFGYTAFASPFIFAALGVLPNLVMYSSKELSNKQIILRKIIQLVFIEAEVLCVCIISPNIPTERAEVITGLIISVLVIFLLANFIIIANDYFSAKKLTKELMLYQKNIKDLPGN